MPSSPERSDAADLMPADGPARPASDPPHAGVLPGVPVTRYDLHRAGGTVRLTAPRTALPGEVHRFAVFPEIALAGGRPDFSSAAIGWQLRTDAGVLRPRDQHGHRVGGRPSPGPGVPDGLPCWLPDQWTVLDLDLAEVAGQEYTVELLVPPGAHGTGYLQDAGAFRPERPDPGDPLAWVHMTRGTHSRPGFSRGNTLPLVCVPHGFTFVTPMTDARERRWIYQWAPDGGPRLEALTFSHCPSPWIGDRGQLHVQPWLGDPVARPMGFAHDAERDGVHHYRVRLDAGVVAEVAPTSHAARFRFDFTAGPQGPHGVVVDQLAGGPTRARPLPDGRVAIEAVVAPEPDASRSQLDPVTFYYGETTGPAVIVEPTPRGGLARVPGIARLLRLPVVGRLLKRSASSVGAVALSTGDPVLELAVAGSFLSVDQARHTLDLEIGERSFSEVLDAAGREWTSILGRLNLAPDATDDQRTTAFTALARLHCWPNAAHENTGSAELPDWRYASPFHRAGAASAPGRTGSRIVRGRLSVNNGFWDTYRTAWPHLGFFTPDLAGYLVDGIVQQYRDGGWTARWSAPGYIDSMPGASADVVLADAATHGVRFDELGGYDSALRNACVPPPHRAMGRKGLETSRFTGYTSTATHEGLSWTLENASTDDVIARWSASLASRAGELGVPDRREEFAANAVWFAQRALAHRRVFDERVGFFQGRRPDGSWRHAPATFDPEAWGGDYTETNAWGMSVTPWHDGAGLAELYGGEEALEERLDAMFATQEGATPDVVGAYGGIIHEMTEARAIRCGMVAMSNQPAHHVPFMYLHTGRPWKTQWWTREILDRLFVGGEIGQGYPGDEDNGEMSAWWLWATVGLYPLHPGSGELAITAPLLGELSVDRGPSGRLTVRADHPEHRFVAALTIDGEPWDAVTVPLSRLSGDVTLDFSLSEHPTGWGAGTRPVSRSSDGVRLWDDLSAAASVEVRRPDRPAQAAPDLVDDRGSGVTPLAPG
ncbi:MAG TPA: GH92 family glycosyl hydrolase, partial [Propionibacteriaceae bacterium]|nr:GH92 family glycosyl hydrolase [Propionibacteriaceae bacterium]